MSYFQLIVNLWQLTIHLVSNLSLSVCTTLLHNQISSNSQAWPTMASAALQPLDTCRQEDKMRASFLSEVMKQKSQKTSSSSSSSSPSSSPSCFWLTSISLLGAVHIWCQAKIGWSMKIKVSNRHFWLKKNHELSKKNLHIYKKNRFFGVIYLLSPTRSTILTCSRRLIENTIGSLITWITLPSFVSW